MSQTAPVDQYTSRERLAQQYDDSRRLRLRQETHRRYGENPVSFLEWVTGHMEIRPGMTVVDVGCGHGIYHRLFRARGGTVIGIDRSLGMVKETIGGCSAIVADAQALPLSTATYDRVACNHVLYHVPDQRQAMRELLRIARPGGRVVIATNGAGNNQRMYEVARLAASDLGHTNDFLRRSPFTLDDADRVREVFPNARVEVFRNTFVFPDPEPAIGYWRSMRDDSELDAAMRRRIVEIIREEGAFRVPLVAGCFVADV
jgi:ubiquinone/menaquinone biosynthesis C-methylase UbiE